MGGSVAPRFREPRHGADPHRPGEPQSGPYQREFFRPRFALFRIAFRRCRGLVEASRPPGCDPTISRTSSRQFPRVPVLVAERLFSRESRITCDLETRRRRASVSISKRSLGGSLSEIVVTLDGNTDLPNWQYLQVFVSERPHR